MDLQRSSKIILALFSFLTACSVYQSSGRKSFESKAPEQIQRQTAAAVQTDNDMLTCWNQPANEPLWHVESQKSLTVTQLPENQIQVCFNEAP